MRGRLVPLLLLALSLCPVPASAHLVSTGFGPYYDGISHLFISPDDLLGVLGLALLAGLGGTRPGRWALLLLPAGWLVGGLLGLRATTEIYLPVANTLSFLLMGALVALGRRLPIGVLFVFAMTLGLFHGMQNGTAMAAAGAGVVALLGIVTAVFVVTALVTALAVSARLPWTRIAVRAAGSWIAAIGVLMLGWTLRGGG